MPFKLTAEDVEIEQLHPGGIIHIFPEGDTYQAIEDIVKGLCTLNDMEQLIQDWDQTIKAAPQEDYVLMAFAELKRVLESITRNSEKESLKVMEKLKATKA